MKAAFEIKSEQDIIQCLGQSPFHIAALRAARTLDLPDCCIGAGFIRNYVWDQLHGHTTMTPLNDIDVLYFDPADLTKATEKSHEQKLEARMPGHRWSVKNQARMHLKYHNAPYENVSHALTHWCETVTPIAAALDANDKLTLLAPLGLTDLLAMQCHPTPYAQSTPAKLADYQTRMAEKKWWEIWPQVKVYRDYKFT